MKPEILFLVHRIPYPPDKGDKIRSWRLLQFLAKRFRVHLACFVDDKRDLVHREFLESHCESVTLIPLDPIWARIRSVMGFATGAPLSFHYFRDPRMTRAVRKLRQKPLAAEVAFSSSMAPYIDKPMPARKRIIDFCDADSKKWRGYAKDTKGVMALVYKREAKTLAAQETIIANWADASFAISAEEAAIFNARPGMKGSVGWYANGVDTDFFNPTLVDAFTAPKHDLVFVGAMDYRANFASVIQFLDRVWPQIRAARPDATFAIVGPNPPISLVALSGANGITVTGRVDDVRPWLAGASVVVAPLRVAQGVQNKVLEAMAMERPVVATPEAMTGITMPKDSLSPPATPEEMTAQILELLAGDQKRRAAGEAARRHVVANYSWDTAFRRLAEKLDSLGL